MERVLLTLLNTVFLDRKSPKEGISVKVEKCEIHKCPVSSPGCLVIEGPMKMGQLKVQAVIDWPTLSSH